MKIGEQNEEQKVTTMKNRNMAEGEVKISKIMRNKEEKEEKGEIQKETK